MSGRILVIRGGAIGDFILTLPALGLIRENLPTIRIEILGYPGIACLGLDPRYADAVHSIEYGPLARCFIKNASLDPELSAFFSSYQQIISYLYDPDGIFAHNLRTAGVKNLLIGPGKLDDSAHAVQQLAQPLEKLAFFLEDALPRFTPRSIDLEAAHPVLKKFTAPFLAFHPGSGSSHKNWPVKNWRTLIEHCLQRAIPLLLIAGEADEKELSAFADYGLPTAAHLPLRTLGAILSQSCGYLGHDTGISHLAAAAGARCLLFFGPTDPEIWGPLHPQVNILKSSTGSMDAITPDIVLPHLDSLLGTKTAP